MTETRSLHRKLAQVMYEAERIPKNGTAPREMGGYKFVQVGDAADYIRKALAEKVITMMPTAVHVVGQQDRPTKSGGNMTTVDLVTEWTLTDGESGESITIMSFGSGADGGDKYSGKASTSAMKYALLTGFLLSTGDDTEASTLPETAPAPPPDVTGATEILIGVTTEEGTVRKGGSNSQLEVRETPDGPAFGFKLETAKGGIPQVVVKGDAAVVAIAGTGGDPATLLGHWVRVKGKLYSVRAPGRQSFNRLHVEAIETHEWRYPAETVQAEPSAPAEPVVVAGDVDPASPAAAPDPDLAAFRAANPELGLLEGAG